MHCEHCENNLEFDVEKDIIVDVGSAARSVLMCVGDALIDLCNELGIGEIKIKVSQNYESGETVLKAKVDGEKVLEITASNFMLCLEE